jgi:hypothetical protein
MNGKLTFPSKIILGIIPKAGIPNILLAFFCVFCIIKIYSTRIIANVRIPPIKAAAIINIALLVGLGDKG